MKRTKMDLICPVYWVDEKFFYRNIKSWIKELPLKKIILGINNPDLDISQKILEEKEIISQDLDYIDQLHLKTLGGCLVDLMNRVETDWFVFVHSDVFITPYAFEIMKHYMKPNVGIIESERLHWNGAVSRIYQKFMIPAYTFDNYYNHDRAYSGFQIFQKQAIQSIVDKIRDDYIYRNEDLIFQYECLMNGYEYWKTLALHIHQNSNTLWTFPEMEAYIMQVNGLIKYTEPLPRITQEVCLNALSYLKSKGVYRIYDVERICNKFKKKNWKKLIFKKWDDL